MAESRRALVRRVDQKQIKRARTPAQGARSGHSPVHRLTNETPKPFVWMKTADEILASVARFCHRISETGH